MDAALLRLPLAVAYPLLAHAASHFDSDALASVALFDLALILLVGPLARLRPWALALLAALAAGLWWLAGSGHAQLPLLAPPFLFMAWLAWWFARSLRAGRVALITRIVAALERRDAATLDPALLRYTRTLTGAWAALLAGLSIANATLATIAVPHGLLARLGQPPVVDVAQAQWSLFANLANYGIVAAFFLLEYAFRSRRFPDRPYRSFGGFLMMMARLEPAFWRGLFRP